MSDNSGQTQTANNGNKEASPQPQQQSSPPANSAGGATPAAGQQHPVENSIAPVIIPNTCPPGLEYLMSTNRVIIEQLVDWQEMMINVHASNRYHILDHFNRRMYFAAEIPTGALMMGATRPWTIQIYNNMGQMVLNGFRMNDMMNRSNLVTVCLPNGQQIGGVVQTSNFGTASWLITNGMGEPVLGLGSPPGSMMYGSATTSGAADFVLYSLSLMNGSYTMLGRISKYWGGYAREMMTESDTFGIEFPMDLDPKIKAVLVYATFMIDFMFYENVNQHHRRHVVGGHFHHHRTFF